MRTPSPFAALLPPVILAPGTRHSARIQITPANAATAPIGAGIITDEVAGKQHIAVVGGSISPISPIWPLPTATSRVTVFSLP